MMFKCSLMMFKCSLLLFKCSLTMFKCSLIMFRWRSSIVSAWCLIFANVGSAMSLKTYVLLLDRKFFGPVICYVYGRSNRTTHTLLQFKGLSLM